MSVDPRCTDIDEGPWPCTEPGCPAPLIGCSPLSNQTGFLNEDAALRSRCALRFSSLWEHPPLSFSSKIAGDPVANHCPKTCSNACSSQTAVHQPSIPRNATCFLSEYTWASRVTLMQSVDELVHPPRHWFRFMPPGTSTMAKCCLFYPGGRFERVRKVRTAHMAHALRCIDWPFSFTVTQSALAPSVHR